MESSWLAELPAILRLGDAGKVTGLLLRKHTEYVGHRLPLSVSDVGSAMAWVPHGCIVSQLPYW